MMIYRTGETGVRCGNRAAHGDTFTYHTNAQAVQACFLGDGVCDWLMDLGRDPEGGETVVMECGAARHVTEQGWSCDSGHERLAYGSAAQQAEERIEAMVEQFASH